MSSGRIALLLLFFIVGLVVYMSAFIVDKTEIALRFQFGKIQQTYTKPGLYFMTPFINKVRKIDNRRLTLDKPKATYLTGDQKNLNIDYFAVWRIEKPVRYYNSLDWSIGAGNDLLAKIINGALAAEIRNYNITQVISDKRQQLMNSLVKISNLKVKEDYGIVVLDVRLKQVEFPPGVRTKVFETMIEERNKRSTEHKSKGEAKAKKIKAIADKEKTIILAKARQQGMETRGKGDAEATKITAEIYKKNTEFFAFMRTLEGYEKIFSTQKTMIIDEKDEFFKYFGNSKGK